MAFLSDDEMSADFGSKVRRNVSPDKEDQEHFEEAYFDF